MDAIGSAVNIIMNTAMFSSVALNVVMGGSMQLMWGMVNTN
jgi:hypothetical protein